MILFFFVLFVSLARFSDSLALELPILVLDWSSDYVKSARLRVRWHASLVWRFACAFLPLSFSCIHSRANPFFSFSFNARICFAFFAHLVGGAHSSSVPCLARHRRSTTLLDSSTLYSTNKARASWRAELLFRNIAACLDALRWRQQQAATRWLLQQACPNCFAALKKHQSKSCILSNSSHWLVEFSGV